MPGWLGHSGLEVRTGMSIGNHSESAAALELVPRPSFDVVLKWLRTGLLVGTTRAGTEGDAPDIGFGVDFAVGFERDFGRWSALPGVSYRYLTANTPASSAYAIALSAHLGIAIGLGGC